MYRMHAFCLAAALAGTAHAQQPAAGGKPQAPAAPEDGALSRLLLRLAPTPLPHRLSIASVTFSADGRTVTTVCNGDAQVFQWDAATGKLLRQFRLPQNWVAGSSVGAGGRLLASADRAGRVALWDTTSGKRLHLLKDTAGMALALSPDGKSLVAGLPDGRLGVWDTATGKPRCRLPRSAWSAGLALTFSPDGSRIAASRPDGSIGVWDAKSGKELRSLPAGAGDLRLLAFTPDNQHLASADRGGLVRVWSLGSGRQRRHVQLPAGHIPTCGLFTPDGRALLTGGTDGTVRLWEVASGQERHAFPDLPRGVTGAALASDGRSVVIAGGDNVALVRALDSATSGPFGASPGPKDLGQAWADLASPDAGRAYRAVAALAGRKTQAVAYLKEQLRPDSPAVAGEVARLLKELDSPRFAERRKAMARLEGTSQQTEDALVKALEGKLPLEVRRRVEQFLGRRQRAGLTPEQLRPLRAVEALERIGTAEAREVLRALAGGTAGGPLTEEARAALRRLRKPSADPR